MDEGMPCDSFMIEHQAWLERAANRRAWVEQREGMR